MIDNTPKIPIAITSLTYGWYEFTPQPDITAYELALCVRIILLNTNNSEMAYQEMVNGSVTHHFTKDVPKQKNMVREKAKMKRQSRLPGERNVAEFDKQIDDWERDKIAEIDGQGVKKS